MSRRPPSDDDLLMAELRVLKPKIDRLLDMITERAEEDGAFKADVRRTMDDVRYVLRELRDGDGGRPSLLQTMAEVNKRVGSLEDWRKAQEIAQVEKEREARKLRITVILFIIGQVITLIGLFLSMRNGGHP
jgi:hypothetical protein